MNRCQHLAAFVAGLLLYGHALAGDAPLIQPEKAARITVRPADASGFWICIGGKRRDLQIDASGHGAIPADGYRYTFGYDFRGSNGYTSASCSPKASVIPSSGEGYYLDFDMDSHSCHLSIFREDSSRRTGLALEPTLGRPQQCLQD